MDWVGERAARGGKARGEIIIGNWQLAIGKIQRELMRN